MKRLYGFKTLSVGLSLFVSMLVLTMISSCGGGGIPTTGSVSGMVTSTQGGPVQGVTVTSSGKSFITKADGRFTLENIPEGTQTISAVRMGFGNYTSTVVVNAGSNTIKNIEITPQSIGTVQGRVTGSLGGRLSGVVVSIGTITSNTDLEGNYTLVDVPAGLQTITAVKSGYQAAEQEVMVYNGEITIKDIQLTPDSNLTSGDLSEDDMEEKNDAEGEYMHVNEPETFIE
jgi:hypothetical protein